MHNLCMNDIRTRVVDLRKQRKWTQGRLSQLSGVDASAISRFEKGERGLNVEKLGMLAGAFGVGLDALIVSTSNVDLAPHDVRRIPVIDYVQAGKWAEVQMRLAEGDFQETSATSVECAPSSFKMRIRGDSMQPLFKEGDLVTIDQTVTPMPGDYVVAVDETGDATFKKYRSLGVDAKGRNVFELVALNENYGPMRSDRQQIAIVGVMMEHLIPRRKFPGI